MNTVPISSKRSVFLFYNPKFNFIQPYKAIKNVLTKSLTTFYNFNKSFVWKEKIIKISEALFKNCSCWEQLNIINYVYHN